MGPVLIVAGLCLPFLVRLLVAAAPEPEEPVETHHWPRVINGCDPDELLASSVCILNNVRVTSLVSLDEEVLVGFWGCGGTWFAPDDERANRLGIVRDPGWLEGSMALSLPWPFARRRATDTLTQWQTLGTPLTAFVSVQHELVGLTDLVTGTVFASELPDAWLGRTPASSGR